MPKTAYEKALEKQQKEAKKLAEQEARRQRAATIVNGQPLIGGLRIMDSSAEELFQSILGCYEENDGRQVKGNYDAIPVAYHTSLQLEMEKLCMYGVIASPRVWINAMWDATITPQGLTYFEDKKRVLQEKGQEKPQAHTARKQYDVFISHASKDKSDYVESLYLTLRRLGISIFYDSDSISWGDNWKQAILDGTAVSEFAIIVISENFFDREWTERELHEFLQRQNESGQKIVLPLLHNITREQLTQHYPELEEIQMIDTARQSKENITILFAKELIKRYK